MRKLLTTTLALLLLPLATTAGADDQKTFRWVDKEGAIHYGDKIPAEFAEMEKQILNEHGVTVDTLRGKRTAEEIAEEKRQELMAREIEVQRRQDMALLATYMSVEEILMHRDRRIELFQAQSRVTELYLKNLELRLDKLMTHAQQFQPYSEDTEAPMIDPDLSNDIATTKETIERHENNLDRFVGDEHDIVERFEIDINRFRKIKGLDQIANNDPADGSDT
jgi:hypothetical protein